MPQNKTQIPKLTQNQIDAIGSLKWAMLHFGGLLTGSSVRRRTILALIDKGIAESVGMVMQCDADGGIYWNRREREGFKLTGYGMSIYKALHEMDLV